MCSYQYYEAPSVNYTAINLSEAAYAENIICKILKMDNIRKPIILNTNPNSILNIHSSTIHNITLNTTMVKRNTVTLSVALALAQPVHPIC